ncbi:hypothetical protein CIN01S_17_00160 [Chryseobacterium indologenes NBRC 14944]|nr:hypothetical protein CIN01S_17_00160 [Chryseobacterium indologenes NBRC 14944]
MGLANESIFFMIDNRPCTRSTDGKISFEIKLPLEQIPIDTRQKTATTFPTNLFISYDLCVCHYSTTTFKPISKKRDLFYV